MKSPLYHGLLALIVSIGVSIGYGVWYGTVSSKSSEVLQLQGKIVASSANASRMATARIAFAQISGDEAKVQSYFVSEDSIVSFITDLQSRGLSHKVVVKVLSVSKGTSSQSTLVLALSLSGTFDAVMRTLGTIEYAPYAISITTLSVQQDTQNSWHADLNLAVGSTPLSRATSTPSSL
jgi:hypothetical protein